MMNNAQPYPLRAYSLMGEIGRKLNVTIMEQRDVSTTQGGHREGESTPFRKQGKCAGGC